MTTDRDQQDRQAFEEFLKSEQWLLVRLKDGKPVEAARIVWQAALRIAAERRKKEEPVLFWDGRTRVWFKIDQSDELPPAVKDWTPLILRDPEQP